MKKLWSKLKKTNQYVEDYANWLIKRKWLVLILTLAIGFLAASGGRFLSFNNDYQVFFSKQNPQLQAFQALQKKYTKDDTLSKEKVAAEAVAQ